MRYGDVIDQILPRAKRLGLTDPETGQVDAAECELALLHVIRGIVEVWDLDAFTVINTGLFLTQEGADTYPLPDDFGRLIHPREKSEYGIFLNDGSNSIPLDYVRPEDWLRNRATTNGRPARFTVSQKTLRLDPPPDTNNSSNYKGEGVYIQEVDEIELDDLVPFGQPVALIDATLAELAILAAKPGMEGIIAKSRDGIVRLVNHEKRMRQGFQQNITNRIGRSTR